jgi:pyrroline-5-carboxylate reductase
MALRLALIGGGKMGEGFLAGVLRANVAEPSSVTVAEIFPARRLELAERYGVSVTERAADALPGAEVVLIAVKPQDLSAVAKELAGAIPSDALVISIAAGITLGELRERTQHQAVVRVMPNLPASVGAGAAAYFVAPEVTADQREQVQAILSAVASAAVEVDSDALIDLGTALHGSGPAFVLLAMEAMIDAAVRLGLKRPDAEALALATFEGTARWARESDESLAQLRNAVTSPGGTTAAGLAALDAHAARAAFDAAIEAAYNRGRELGEAGD